MAKASKRERKFQATGGVKGRLEKGTVTNKGKLRKRRKQKSNDGGVPKADGAAPKRRRVAGDLLGGENLADLDIESFFAKIADESTTTLDEEDAPDATDDSPSATKGKPSKAEDIASSSDDSDDEDANVTEAKMKAEMAKMSEADPEFHDFLKENDETLLEFGHEADQDDEDGDEDDAEEDGSMPKKETAQDQIHLTKKVLSTLDKGAFKSHSVKSLKKLTAAYKSACHLADASGATEGGSRPGESGSLYVIDSSKIFDELMLMCLNRCHEEFRFHLLGPPKVPEKDSDAASQEVDETKSLNPKTLENSAKWTDIRPIMQSFFRSTLHVMSEAKEPELLTFILKALAKYIPFLAAFPRIAEPMLKSLTALWSAPLDTSEDYQVVRLNAFFRIRQLALTQPFPFIEDVLKKTYLAYARRARFGTAATVTSVLPTLTFMGNCLCELYSLDIHSSYQHCFVYIRQLALLLRSATQKKTPEAMQQVYCWQYIHCLKLWVAVLSDALSGDDDKDSALMRSLIYPLTEVIIGTVRFVPSPTRHLPLRLHCVRLLQQLAAAAETFIPTTSLLLECFDWKEWYMAPKKSSKPGGGVRGGLQMDLILKLVPKEDALRTHEQREAGINAVLLLLDREVELYRYSAGFPEFSIRIVQRLRQFAKEGSSARWRALAKNCVDVCESYSTYAVKARSKLQEAPKNLKILECLRPPAEKSMQERHEASVKREQAQKQLLTGGKPSSSKKDKDEDVDEKDQNTTKQARKTAKTKKRVPAARNIAAPQAAHGLLEQEDNIQEGVDWSDEE